jgi:hypothetical protein
MRLLENFILEVPYLFLRKVPYAWVPIVALWAWPPYLSGIFVLILLIGLGLMLFQQYAWEQRVKRTQRVIYRDHPRAPFSYWGRNLLWLITVCAALGWLFNGRLGLNAFQWAVLLLGIMATYKDALLFGAGVVYLITDKGIALRYVPGHIDYRLFFGYDEIRRVVHIHDISKREFSWDIFSPTRKVQEGLLLVPRNPDGFSKQVNKVVLTPTNIEVFLKHFPKDLTNAL